MDISAPAFFVRLLHSSTQAHMLHLKSKSYAQHMALGELYEGLPGLVDSLVETYQGCEGVIEEYPAVAVTPADDPLVFVGALRDFICDNRKSVGDESELQNIVDEVLALVKKTLYKLENLK